jgi:hypothetical protein
MTSPSLKEKQHYNSEYFTKRWSKDWEMFIEENHNFSFQSSRTFLDTKPSLYEDASLIAYNKDEKLIAVLPIGVLSTNNTLISHPKSSFGGITFLKELDFETRLSVYQDFLLMLSRDFDGFRLIFRVPPSHLCNERYNFESWALWSLGFQPISMYVHSAIDLEKEFKFDFKRIRKVTNSNILVIENPGEKALGEFWEILTEVLSSRYGISPVHSFSQFLGLQDLFRPSIRTFIGIDNDVVVGGLVFFNTASAYHLQYMGIGSIGRSLAAGDVLIQHAISSAAKEGYRYFSFGHSNENEGRNINQSLLSFKKKFGAEEFVSTYWGKDLQNLNVTSVR